MASIMLLATCGVCMLHVDITSRRLRCDSVSALTLVSLSQCCSHQLFTGEEELKEDQEVQKIGRWLDVCTGGRRKLMGGGLLDVSRPSSCAVLLI